MEGVFNTYSNMVYRLAFSQTRNKSDADDIYQAKKCGHHLGKRK